MQVERIDHVHMEVADREAAARWYGDVLGLTRHAGLAQWADDPMGPLVLAGGNGQPALTLFARGQKPVSRDSTVAFRCDAQRFLAFCERLEGAGIMARDGQVLTRADVTDHQLSWSLYFVDPDGNYLELTSYDYDAIADAMRDW